MTDARRKQTCVYKRVGELAIELDVYLPNATGPLAVVLWFHGGALIMGSRLSLPADALFDRLLNSGYAVVSVDYRLAPETQLAGIVQDVEDAYGWVLTKGQALCGLDPNRIAIMGMSAGGYLTLSAGFRVTPKPKALVSFYGYGDLTGPWYTEPSAFYCQHYGLVGHEQAYKTVRGPAIAGAPTKEAMQGRPDFYLHCRQNGLWPKLVGGHDPAQEPAWFHAYEALRNITPAFPPTLLLHGEKDTDVPYQQSVLLARELARHGVEHGFVSNRDWGHAFDQDTTGPDIDNAFDRVMAFISAHIGPSSRQ